MKQILLHFTVIVTIVCLSSFTHLKKVSVENKITFLGMTLEITPEAQATIQKDINNLRNNSTYFQKKLEKIKFYFPTIEKALKEEGVPNDFKYLAVQESSLIADAVSTSNAVGYWQFKEATAREVGIIINDKVDERMEIVASTKGAAKYLKTNFFYFGNWVYALLAYNTGKTGALDYIDQKYISVRKMKIDKTTHWYIKRCIAHKLAFEQELNAQSHTPSSLGTLKTEPVSGKKLTFIAQKHNTNLNALKEYNKWLKKEQIPTDKNYIVAIPELNSLSSFASNDNHNQNNNLQHSNNGIQHSKTTVHPLQQHPIIKKARNSNVTLINGIPGIVAQSQLTFQKMARIGGISLEKFIEYNDLTKWDNVKLGQVYYFAKKHNKSEAQYHTIQVGETLWDVSQKYGIKLSKILERNRLKTETDVKAGLRVNLRYIKPNNGIKQQQAQVKKRASNNTSHFTAHKVQEKETIFSISKNYNVLPEDIMAWNNKNTPNLKYGEILKIKK